MIALVEGLVQKFGFKANSTGSAGISRRPRRTASPGATADEAPMLVGAASLYVFLVSSLLWSAPAWMVVLAPFVQTGVAESLYCHFGKDKRRDK